MDLSYNLSCDRFTCHHPLITQLIPNWLMTCQKHKKKTWQLTLVASYQKPTGQKMYKLFLLVYALITAHLAIVIMNYRYASYEYIPPNLFLVLLQVPKCFVLVQIFWDSPKIWLHLVPLQKLLCWQKNQFYWIQIIFLSGKNCLWLSQYVNKFLVWHKKFRPAQNILGPVKGQGIWSF